MLARYEVVTPPATEPVTLVELKSHLRITATDEDALLQALLGASVLAVENYTGRKLIQQTLAAWYDRGFIATTEIREGFSQGARVSFSPRTLFLGYCPLVSVDSITYYTLDDVAHVFASENYYVDSVSPDRRGRVVLNDSATWPSSLRAVNAIKVTHTVGYANAASVPQALKLGVKTVAAFMYEHRGDCSDCENKALNQTSANLILQQYRIPRM